MAVWLALTTAGISAVRLRLPPLDATCMLANMFIALLVMMQYWSPAVQPLAVPLFLLMAVIGFVLGCCVCTCVLPTTAGRLLTGHLAEQLALVGEATAALMRAVMQEPDPPEEGAGRKRALEVEELQRLDSRSLRGEAVPDEDAGSVLDHFRVVLMQRLRAWNALGGAMPALLLCPFLDADMYAWTGRRQRFPGRSLAAMYGLLRSYVMVMNMPAETFGLDRYYKRETTRLYQRHSQLISGAGDAAHAAAQALADVLLNRMDFDSALQLLRQVEEVCGQLRGLVGRETGDDQAKMDLVMLSDGYTLITDLLRRMYECGSAVVELLQPGAQAAMAVYASKHPLYRHDSGFEPGDAQGWRSGDLGDVIIGAQKVEDSTSRGAAAEAGPVRGDGHSTDGNCSAAPPRSACHPTGRRPQQRRHKYDGPDLSYWSWLEGGRRARAEGLFQRTGLDAVMLTKIAQATLGFLPGVVLWTVPGLVAATARQGVIWPLYAVPVFTPDAGSFVQYSLLQLGATATAGCLGTLGQWLVTLAAGAGGGAGLGKLATAGGYAFVVGVLLEQLLQRLGLQAVLLSMLLRMNVPVLLFAGYHVTSAPLTVLLFRTAVALAAQLCLLLVQAVFLPITSRRAVRYTQAQALAKADEVYDAVYTTVIGHQCATQSQGEGQEGGDAALPEEPLALRPVCARGAVQAGVGHHFQAVIVPVTQGINHVARLFPMLRHAVRESRVWFRHDRFQSDAALVAHGLTGNLLTRAVYMALMMDAAGMAGGIGPLSQEGAAAARAAHVAVRHGLQALRYVALGAIHPTRAVEAYVQLREAGAALARCPDFAAASPQPVALIGSRRTLLVALTLSTARLVRLLIPELVLLGARRAQRDEVLIEAQDALPITTHRNFQREVEAVQSMIVATYYQGRYYTVGDEDDAPDTVLQMLRSSLGKVEVVVALPSRLAANVY